MLNFFTGAHEDYHRPTDTAEKLNYEGLERIAKFAQQIVLDLASAPERPDFARVERSDSRRRLARDVARVSRHDSGLHHRGERREAQRRARRQPGGERRGCKAAT